ncbi:uncharacterized protein LOC128225704 [Mya arenaria]|uniref:uncharacterized protein LOC128225704 n=1 Tax=Mya arenaria TaxID=6604 RepID=UPI0022E6547C|nr:uncharacterized protein LOC128225704 [Mya arenaria]
MTVCIQVLCLSIDDFQADDNNSYIILGGNHLVSAMKLIMADQTSSDYECLGKVNAQVYVGLNDVEALYLSSLHNAKTKTLQLSFQDKVRVARRAYMKNEDSWKEEAVVSLGYIEGKTHTKAGLSTILSVACYSTNNYLLVEQVFNHFSDGSFPQMLFRNLQSVADDKRTPYLSKAVGTNGVKVSRIIVADKRRENLKILACQSLNQQTWEDVEEHFFKSEEMLRYTGEISSPEGRGRYVTFVNKLSLNSDNCVIISIIVNGIERTFDNEILGKKIKEIKTLVEKEIMNEE